MNPFNLIPPPDVIPVSGAIFKGLLTATFMIHLLLMNIMAGGAIIALATRFNNKMLPLQKDMAKKLPIVIALAINFGVAPLLFLQVLYGQFMYVSTALMAVFWLSVIVLLIIAYYNLYLYKFGFDDLSETAKKLLLGSAVLFFLMIAFFFTNNMTLMLNLKSWAGYFSRADGFLLNLADPALIPRYLHFITASAAIAGLFIAIVWTLKKNNGAAAEADSYIVQGMNWFTFSTVAQIAIGFWFQMSLPKEIVFLFLGKSIWHTALFGLGLLLVVLVIFFGGTRKVWPAAAGTLVLVLDMVLIRDAVRSAYLAPYFKPSSLTVIEQYGPMLLFFVSLLVVAGICIYVLQLAKTASKTAEAPF